MKIATLIFTLLLIVGCSSPTWENMAESEIADWKEQGVSIEVANTLVENKITAAAYADWKAEGIDKPEAVIAWSKKKFAPVEAASWINSKFSLSDAVEYRAKGLQPVK